MTRPTIEHFKKLSVVKPSKDFRSAVAVVDSSLPAEVPEGHVYIRVFYVGVNATDINVTNGAYNYRAQEPFDCGLEAVGVIEQIAHDVTTLAVNDHVLCFTRNAYTEMLNVPASFCVKLPSADPEFIVLAVSALTASIALGEVGKPQNGEVALVTAAAGGTGQIAVQLLKHVYHCTVIGTCSSEDKAAFLKEIGCDYTINYKTDNMDEKLTQYAPHGVNLIYECVGGEVYSTALNHIAVKGRMVIIGAVSSYKSGKEIPFHNAQGMSLQLFLIYHNAILHGFLLWYYEDKYKEYMEKMLEYVKENKVKLNIDKTKSFFGLDSIADALDYMYSGKNLGKVVVKIQE